MQHRQLSGLPVNTQRHQIQQKAFDRCAHRWLIIKNYFYCTSQPHLQLKLNHLSILLRYGGFRVIYEMCVSTPTPVEQAVVSINPQRRLVSSHKSVAICPLFSICCLFYQYLEHKQWEWQWRRAQSATLDMSIKNIHLWHFTSWMCFVNTNIHFKRNFIAL